MCPGCIAAEALHELGPNPIRTLIAAFAAALPAPNGMEPSTVGRQPATKPKRRRAASSAS